MSYYKRHLFMCVNQRENKNCCQDYGAAELRTYAKNKTKELGIAGQGGVRVNQAGCLDRCDEGPVAVVYPDNVWYTYKDEADIDEIITRHLIKGEIVERLKI
jgi:(2Fe-2S) ferredoxin